MSAFLYFVKHYIDQWICTGLLHTTPVPWTRHITVCNNCTRICAFVPTLCNHRPLSYLGTKSSIQDLTLPRVTPNVALAPPQQKQKPIGLFSVSAAYLLTNILQLIVNNCWETNGPSTWKNYFRKVMVINAVFCKRPEERYKHSITYPSLPITRLRSELKSSRTTRVSLGRCSNVVCSAFMDGATPLKIFTKVLYAH